MLFAVGGDVAAVLGLAFEFHLSEAECDACADEAAVESFVGTFAQEVGVGVFATRAKSGAPVEEVLDVDEG